MTLQVDPDQFKRIANIAIGALIALSIFSLLLLMWIRMAGVSGMDQNNCIRLEVSGEGHEIDIQTQGSVEEGAASNTPKNVRATTDTVGLDDLQSSIDALKGKGNLDEQNQQIQELLNDRTNQSRRTPRG